MKEELLPSDKVMIEFGPKTQVNAQTGETIVIEQSKTLDMPFSYFLEVTGGEEGSDDYNPKTGWAKTIGRTVKLAGQAEYVEETTERGDVITVAKATDFETTQSRAIAKAQKEADEKAAAKAKAEKEKAEKEQQAKADFDAKQRADAEAEQQKRKIAADAETAAATKEATGDAKAKADAKAASKQSDTVVVDPNATAAPALNQ